MQKKINTASRRKFIKQSAFAASAFWIASPRVLGREGSLSPSDKLNIAAIGVGGRGGDDLNECASENIIALCDVDDKNAERSFNRYETTPKYRDYRVMLDKHGDADAVIVATPDHTHAVIALEAIRRGKHVYVEKPLAHSIYEVRTLMKAARDQKVITQLGNQGHSFDDIRNVCEWVWDGAIGPVREVRIGYNWGMGFYGDGKGRPEDTPPVPETLDWDLWLGPAAQRPYHPAYVPFNWRSWRDFGTGVMGDWVCHVLDPSFWALKLSAPTRVQAKNGGGDVSSERYALQSVIEYDFPARGDLPPVKVTWSYGTPVAIPQLKGTPHESSEIAAALIGEKGAVVHGSHGGGGACIVPESLSSEYQKPAQTLPRVPGGHHQDWIRACKENRPAGSDFSYGGPLTEVALLGVIATFLNGVPLEWDADGMKFTNNEEANRYLHPAFREGWTI